jgi:hypothetical protein
MSGSAISGHWGVYLDAIREHSHQLLAWAYTDIRSRINADTQEPAITGLLCEAMKRRINAAGTPEIYAHYAIGDQEPVSPAGELGNDRLRLDIHVLRTAIRPHLGYVFEAKRLRTGGYPIGKYTGHGGMGDFLSCRYAQGCPEGAMIGFYQDRDSAYWVRELERIFAADTSASRPNLGIRSGLSRRVMIDSMRESYRSEHERTDGTIIVLFHVLLGAS